jgi:hypothetical protein
MNDTSEPESLARKVDVNVDEGTWFADVAGVNSVIVLDPVLDAVGEKYVDDTLDLRPSELALQNRSSSLLTRPPLGGGGIRIVFPSDEPLVTVTGDPNKLPEPLARVTAFLNSSSRSVVDPLLFRELRRLGVIERRSPG